MLDELPALEGYQSRVCRGAAAAVLDEGRDVVIQAPTGAGKTPIIARTAKELIDAGLNVLVVTHRKELLSQMTGKPGDPDDKSRAGEMLWWGGIKPGTIADASLGGWAQEPNLVVAMVETAARNLDNLKAYDAILVDEAHHLSEESASREEVGSYAAIIEAQPDAKIIALTATPFRGDRDRLHPRLEAAHLEVVSHEEALASKRIVPIRTYIGQARLENGRTPDDLQRMENEGKIENASALTKASRGEAFYERVTLDWDRVAKQRPTIMFVDSTKGVDDMVERMNAAYGTDVAKGISSKKSRQENGDAIEAYRQGCSKVLVSCLMIGEGFDVPRTDVVMSLFSSLSRTAMNQFAGRCGRSDGVSDHGLFMDYGTATAMHGPIEAQHRIQNIDALAAYRSRIAGARLLGMVAPVSMNGWSCVPGHERSLLIHRRNDRYEVYGMDHKAEREVGRRPAKGAGSVTRPRQVQFEGSEGRPISADVLMPFIAAHVRGEGSFYAREGGFGTEEYVSRSKGTLESWISTLALLRPPVNESAPQSEAALARREFVAASLRGEDQGGRNSRLVGRAIGSWTNGREMATETISLMGHAFEAYASSEAMPLGARFEAQEVSKEIRRDEFDAVPQKQMRVEAQMTQTIANRLIEAAEPGPISKVLKDLSVPLSKSIEMLDREMGGPAKRQSLR
jgi:superfamily II DNA or RNA helicase